MNSLPTTTDPTHRPPKTILVVDDDEAVRTGLRCVLVTEGYRVIEAVDGCEAVQLFCEHACDLALLDMNMPVRNGWGTIASLRFLDPVLPVIVITARPDQRSLAREAGVELMEKPLDLPLLLQRIEALAQRPPSEAEAPVGTTIPA